VENSRSRVYCLSETSSNHVIQAIRIEESLHDPTGHKRNWTGFDKRVENRWQHSGYPAGQMDPLIVCFARYYIARPSFTMVGLPETTVKEAKDRVRSALEQLREPLESGEVHISRAAQQVTFPANFQLVAAMNPWNFIVSTD